MIFVFKLILIAIFTQAFIIICAVDLKPLPDWLEASIIFWTIAGALFSVTSLVADLI